MNECNTRCPLKEARFAEWQQASANADPLQRLGLAAMVGIIGVSNVSHALFTCTSRRLSAKAWVPDADCVEGTRNIIEGGLDQSKLDPRQHLLLDQYFRGPSDAAPESPAQ